MEGETMDFLYGLGIILVASVLILLPTLLRKLRKKPDDDLDRFFTDKKEDNDESEHIKKRTDH